MEESKQIKPRKIRLSRYYRLFLFFIMASIEAVMNIANGLLSSATKEIKKSLNMNDAKFGSFGTANSFGRIISSTLFGMLNQKVSRKWSTTLGIGFHAIFVLCFQVTICSRFTWIYSNASFYICSSMDRSICYKIY